MFIKYQYLQHLKVNWINNNSGLFPESRSEIMGGSQTQYSILHNGKSASPQDIDNTLPRLLVSCSVPFARSSKRAPRIGIGAPGKITRDVAHYDFKFHDTGCVRYLFMPPVLAVKP